MQVDQNKIIETFERIEEEAGGLWNAMPSMTLDKTAVMTSHWTQQGAG